RMFVFSGALACGSGDFSLTTWTFDFASETWTRMNPLGPQPIGDAGMLTAYDPNTGLICLHDRRNLFSYNFQANTYTKLRGGPPGGFFGYYGLTAAIDPKRKLFVIIGPDARDGLPHTYTIDISSGGTYAVVDRTTTGDTAITDTGYPGIDYDPVSDRMVAWNGGDTVYSLNLDTNQWSSVTYSGGQSVADPNGGTNGRWRYSPALGVFVVVNSVDLNASVFRLTSAGGTPPSLPTPPASLQVR